MKRRFLAIALGVVFVALAAIEPVSAASQYSHHWTDFGDAPTLYWVVAAILIAFYVGFVHFVQTSDHMVGRKATTRGYFALGVVMLTFALGAFGVYVAAGPGMQWGETPTEDAWDWKPGETLQDPSGTDLTGEPYNGYRVAIAQGCFQGSCHTLYVRPEDTAPDHSSLYYPEPSEAGDYAEMPVPLWGTQRNGPDLANAGRLKPSMQFQKNHLIDPRSTAPDSIMPSYGYLSDEQLNDLSAFLVTLGNDPDTLREGSTELASGTTDSLSETASIGKQVAAEQGCTGCHSTDGRRSTGPTWQGLYDSERTLTDGSTATANEEYLRRAITDPSAQVPDGFPAGVMPSYDGLSDDQVNGLVEYIETLEADDG